jgi:hypothetical protein
VVNGVETILANAGVPAPTVNKLFRIDGSATGNKLILKLDGVQKLTFTDPTPLAGGSVGVLIGSGTSAIRQYRVDQFTGQVQ